MHRLWFILALLLFAMANAEQLPSSSGAFTWEANLTKAILTAKEENKPVMVLVYRVGCPACESIVRRVGKNRFLQVQINAFSHAAVTVETAARYGFTPTRTPTFYFLDAGGTYITAPLEGEPKEDFEFLDYLAQVELAHKKMSLPK